MRVRARSTALCVLPLAVMACTHERPITELHQVAGKRVTVETYDHVSMEGVAIQAADGITFENSAGVMPPTAIAKVTEVRRGRGAAEGAGIGLAVGAVVGAALGFADGDDECDENSGMWCIFVFTAGEKAVMGGVVLGGIGAIVGLVAGAATGSKFVYSYGDQVRITPTGPPGSYGGVTITY
ncbi:MAG TPA: hypothetical protein VMZ53_05470 [Kofleriaceae bacterium]|nr:hypothetical protein [Kofleriaceae bacterium]